MQHAHQLATVWPQVFGVLALIANIVIAISIKRDPRAQLSLTLTAIAITALAASILFVSPKPEHPASATVFYPAADPPARRIPAAIPLRKL